MTMLGAIAVFFRDPCARRALCGVMALAAGNAGCGSDATSTSPPSSVTQTVGPEGGTIAVAGATMTFPSGALTAATSITIAATSEAPPAGFVALSPVFRCEPSGTNFPEKVTVAITFDGDPARSTIFRSSAATPEFTDVGGSVAGTVMTTQVAHFSRGFVGRKL